MYFLSTPLESVLLSSLKDSRVLSPGQSLPLPTLVARGRLTCRHSTYTTICTNQGGLPEGEDSLDRGLTKGAGEAGR